MFDEHELPNCYLTDVDAIRAALHEADTLGDPGFPGEVVDHMMQARFEQAETQYPHEGVLRFGRWTMDGEIPHPYAARRDVEGWIMGLYLPFRQSTSA